VNLLNDGPVWPSRQRVVQMYILRRQAAVCLFNSGSHLAGEAAFDSEAFYNFWGITPEEVNEEMRQVGGQAPPPPPPSSSQSKPNDDSRARGMFNNLMRKVTGRQPNTNPSEESTDHEQA